MSSLPKDRRYLVAGLARPRSPWFNDVARWAGSSLYPLEFMKCLGPAELRMLLERGDPCSAVLVDRGLTIDAPTLELLGRRGIPTIVIGAEDGLMPGFDCPALLAELSARARTVGAMTTSPAGTSPRPEPDGHPLPAWRGRLIAVTGGPGTGTSTTAMAIAQGLAASAGNEGAVLLADLTTRNDLAMYHDAGDVMPGLQEFVELHGTAGASRARLRNQLFESGRGYELLLGLRRTRDWTTVRPARLVAAIDTLRSMFRVVVTDVDAEFDGEAETGSVDIEERNGPARVAVTTADVVAVTGDPTLRGLRSIVRIEHELGLLGVPAQRRVRVVTHAPRSPRARSELTGALRDLAGASVGEGSARTVFVGGRRQVDLSHAVGEPLPESLTTPLARAVASVR